MRYLAWLLLLANLGMLAWILTQPEPQVMRLRPAPIPADVDTLLLLSERDNEPGVNRVPIRQQPAEQEPAEQEPAEQEPAEQEPAEQEPAEQEPLEPQSPHSVTDLSTGPATEPERVCWTVGPLPGQTDADAVRAQLATRGFRVQQVRTEKVREPSDYWIYLPAMSAEAARRVVADLNAHGLTDYYVGRRNYISLGIFAGKGKAQQHLAHLRALGFDAILEQRYRTLEVRWLDIAKTGETLLPAAPVWAEVRTRYPAIDAQRVPCE